MSTERDLTFDQSQLTGHAGIDTDHIELVNLANAFYASLDGMKNEVCRDAFHSLIQKLETHFDYEETVMADFDYPDLIQHKLHHANSRLEIAELWNVCRQDICQVGEGACHQLKNLVRDLIEADLGFGNHLNEQGVQVFIKL